MSVASPRNQLNRHLKGSTATVREVERKAGTRLRSRVAASVVRCHHLDVERMVATVDVVLDPNVRKLQVPLVVSASVRARLLKLAKERREDCTLTLMNYAAERFLYRLSRSKHRHEFVLKGAMLFAVRIGEQYRTTRDLDLLGLEEATEAAINAAVREIVATRVDDDGLSAPWRCIQSGKTIVTAVCAPSRRRISSRPAFTSRLTSGSVTRSLQPRWILSFRRSLATCRRRIS